MKFQYSRVHPNDDDYKILYLDKMKHVITVHFMASNTKPHGLNRLLMSFKYRENEIN